MIQVHSISKRFGTLQAVDEVSFEIGAGEAFALLGPNGAGKSTTIHMLGGLLEPDHGSVTFGAAGSPRDPEVRRRLGVAPQGLAIYDELTGEENLRVFGSLYGLTGARLRERIDWCLEFAQLEDRRKDRAGQYSGGMQRRLNLACALVHGPELLICDEPTVGVDPQSRNLIFESLEELQRAGTALLYTTHYMEEAQRLCERVAIMDHGKLLAIDTVEGLIRSHGGGSLVLAELDSPPPPEARLPGSLEGTCLRVDTDRPFEVVAELGRTGVGIRELRVERPDLERVFLELTGRSLRD